MPKAPKSQPNLATRVKGRKNPFTGQNCTKKHKAAILLADDNLSDEAISSEVGISRMTLHTWKQDPEFAAVVGDCLTHWLHVWDDETIRTMAAEIRATQPATHRPWVALGPVVEGWTHNDRR